MSVWMNLPWGMQPLMALWLEGYNLATCHGCYSVKKTFPPHIPPQTFPLRRQLWFYALKKKRCSHFFSAEWRCKAQKVTCFVKLVTNSSTEIILTQDAALSLSMQYKQKKTKNKTAWGEIPRGPTSVITEDKHTDTLHSVEKGKCWDNNMFC